jgi:hypothetical protein
MLGEWGLSLNDTHDLLLTRDKVTCCGETLAR